MSRLQIASESGIGESRLRFYEASGVLPRYGRVPDEAYRDRLELILAADRGGLSGQRIRRALEACGEEDGKMENVIFGALVPDVKSPAGFTLRLNREDGPRLREAYTSGRALTFDVAPYETPDQFEAERSIRIAAASSRRRFSRFERREREIAGDDAPSARADEDVESMTASETLTAEYERDVARIRIAGGVVPSQPQWAESHRVLNPALWQKARLERSAGSRANVAAKNLIAARAKAAEARALSERDAAPHPVRDEIERKVREAMTANPGLTAVEAHRAVHAEDRTLWDRLQGEKHGRKQ